MLIDTNIILEIGLGQKHANDCGVLLDKIAFDQILEKAYITEFSLNAICAICNNSQFLRDFLLLISDGKIEKINLTMEDYFVVNAVKKDLKLDFDDALQFIVANKLKTYLVTFDKDFKKTSLETKIPSEIL